LGATGGVISGDLTVTGNLTISGNTTFVQTEVLSIFDNIIDLNSNFTTGTPTENAGIRIIRGDLNASQLRWNETSDYWQFTNDGTNYSNVGSAAAESYANSAFAAANNATDTWVRSAANAASSYANAAFAAANTGGGSTTDSWARSSANSASSYANGSFEKANSAYNLASAISANGSFVLSVKNDTFVGSGSCTTFTLTSSPANEDYTLITIEGVTQLKSSYSVSGANVIFSQAPKANDNIDILIFTSTGSSQNVIYDSANSAGSYANSAFVAANTADQKAVSAGVYANAAFAAANTGGGSTTDSWSRDAANSASSYANAAFAVANTGGSGTDSWARSSANSASSYANSAYGVANSALANAATSDQKAVSASSYANSSFDRANNSLNVASGGSITGDISITGNLTVTGCTASLTVNTLRTSDHIIDVGFGTTGTPTQNAGLRVLRGDGNPVQIRWVENDDYWEYSNDGTNYVKFGSFSDGVYANAAFNAANSASSYANAAFAAANTGGSGTDSWARDAANSASLYANAAFTAANTGGGGGGGVGQYASTMKVDSFTGTGACTQFTLTQEPSGEDYTIVSINGILQHKAAYSLAGSQITFSEAPESGVAIDVVSLVNKVVGGSAEIFVDNFTGNGTNTSFTLSTTPASENYVTVVFDGVTQLRSSYTVTGTTITFDEAPPNTANIEVTIQKNVVGTFINRNYTGNGSNTNFTVTGGVSANSVLVFQNGIAQRPITDYTVSGNTLTFLTAPTNGEVVQIRELTGDPGSGAAAQSHANSAYLHANAAFAAANTGGGGGLSLGMLIALT
jgi:hypothetical protein